MLSPLVPPPLLSLKPLTLLSRLVLFSPQAFELPRPAHTTLGSLVVVLWFCRQAFHSFGFLQQPLLQAIIFLSPSDQAILLENSRKS